MFWADKIAADVQGFQVVNDSKTPSGRVHVGSLRGVIIHDVIHRALKHAGKPFKFRYGVDDYDALDTVPKYLDPAKFSPYLGFPFAKFLLLSHWPATTPNTLWANSWRCLNTWV